MAQASFGYFGFGVESTPATSVPPTKFLPVKDVDFPIENDFIEVREIRGSRQAYQTFDGAIRPSATFTTSFYPSGGMGVLLKGLFGGVNSGLAGDSTVAYLHEFTDAASLPSLSFERSDARTLGQGVIFQRVPGCKIESMGFTAAFGEDVEVNVSAQGLLFPETPTSKPGTFTYPAVNPFIFTGASVSVDGTPNDLFKSLDFEFTNTLERQEALRGVRTAYRIYEGGLACTLSGTMVFDDLSIYNKFKEAEYMSVTANFVGDEADTATTPDTHYGAEFHWPRVKVSSFGIPMTAGEVMEADVEFEVSYDLATSRIVDVSLTNLDETGSYDD